MKPYSNVVIFGNAGWSEDHCGSSSQQLGLAFLQLGCRLLYINPNLVSPVQLSDYPADFQNLRVSKRLLESVRQILSQWNADPENTLFICSMATAVAPRLLEFFAAARFGIVFRCVDWFSGSEQEHSYDERAAALACEMATLITVSHPEVKKNLPLTGKPIMAMTNGVDLDLFRLSRDVLEKPGDLVEGEVTVGFWGTFWGHRLDWRLTTLLARANTNWHFNFIGDLRYLDVDRASVPSNLHFVGSKRKEELPAYLKYFDVCLIPYRQDVPFAKYSNPIKALESLAALTPVVASPNTSLEQYPGVYLYGSAHEAEDQLRKAASEPLDGEKVLRFVGENTWKRKALDLMTEVAALSR